MHACTHARACSLCVGGRRLGSPSELVVRCRSPRGHELHILRLGPLRLAGDALSRQAMQAAPG
eukprot:4881572-Alexandrium_andersonii.AAC.1